MPVLNISQTIFSGCYRTSPRKRRIVSKINTKVCGKSLVVCSKSFQYFVNKDKVREINSDFLKLREILRQKIESILVGEKVTLLSIKLTNVHAFIRWDINFTEGIRLAVDYIQEHFEVADCNVSEEGLQIPFPMQIARVQTALLAGSCTVTRLRITVKETDPSIEAKKDKSDKRDNKGGLTLQFSPGRVRKAGTKKEYFDTTNISFIFSTFSCTVRKITNFLEKQKFGKEGKNGRISKTSTANSNFATTVPTIRSVEQPAGTGMSKVFTVFLNKALGRRGRGRGRGRRSW